MVGCEGSLWLKLRWDWRPGDQREEGRAQSSGLPFFVTLASQLVLSGLCPLSPA